MKISNSSYAYSGNRNQKESSKLPGDPFELNSKIRIKLEVPLEGNTHFIKLLYATDLDEYGSKLGATRK